MRRIYLIDCPGIVPPSARDSETQKVLKGVVRVEHLSQPEDSVAVLLSRVRPEYMRRTYGVESWTGVDDFLEQLAQRRGKLNRGGEPDRPGVAKVVLNDWIRGRIPFFTPPPALPESSAASLAKLSTTALRATLSLNPDGDSTKRVPGVEQHLGGVVHGVKFVEADQEPASDPAAMVVEDDEEWGGIVDEDELELEEAEREATPLAWDELMAAAAPVSGPASVDEDEDADDLGEADFDAAIAEQAPSDDAELDDDDEPQRPAKEPRMTTSKVRARFSQLPLTLQRKATNFFTTANVKNKSRRGKPTPVAGESKPSVKASGRAKKGRR